MVLDYQDWAVPVSMTIVTCIFRWNWITLQFLFIDSICPEKTTNVHKHIYEIVSSLIHFSYGPFSFCLIWHSWPSQYAILRSPTSLEKNLGITFLVVYGNFGVKHLGPTVHWHSALCTTFCHKYLTSRNSLTDLGDKYSIGCSVAGKIVNVCKSIWVVMKKLQRELKNTHISHTALGQLMGSTSELWSPITVISFF